MYCPNCGKENDGNWKFCRWCGSPLTNASSVSQSPKNNILFKIILAGIIVTASFALTVILLSGKKDRDSNREILAEASSEDISGSHNYTSSQESEPPSEASDTDQDSSQIQETVSLYPAEYGQILREYLNGQRGVSYGMNMEINGFHLNYSAKVGLNPQTGRFEYYFALYDGNQDGQDELYVSSHPTWWTNTITAEGIYSYIQSSLITSLDRSEMSEYNNYYTFVKDMNLKIEERAGGSYHSYQKLNNQGNLEEIMYIWWSADGHFQINDQEVSENDANSQDALYNLPPQIQGTLGTEDTIHQYFAAPQDIQQTSAWPEAPSKAAVAPYTENMDRLSFWGSNWDGNRFTIEDRGNYYELSGISIYRKLYLDAEQVNSLQPGDTLVLRGQTYTLNSIEAQENSYYSAPYYGISLSGPSNEIHSLCPTEDGNHYIVYESSDDPLQEEIYTGPVWVRKDASIMGLDPFTYEVGTYNAADYLTAMKNAGEGSMYLSIMRFRTDKDGYVILMEGQIAG